MPQTNANIQATSASLGDKAKTHVSVRVGGLQLTARGTEIKPKACTCMTRVTAASAGCIWTPPVPELA